jgi:hypothetical protein
MEFYGMQTEEGNQRIKELVTRIRGDGGTVEDALQELTVMVKNPKFPEAMNTVTVKEVLVAFGVIEDPMNTEDTEG